MPAYNLSTRFGRPRHCFWLSVLAVVVVVMLLPGDLYLSSSLWDLQEYVAWRSFAVDSIQAGHFPLWNPYAYSGQPFLGDFISAELYPPNVLFLFLPLVRAFNLSMLLHLLWLGWGVRYWAAQRGYHPAAAALAGVAAALSGPVFMRLPGGQASQLCTLAWAPWMFAALEAAWRGPAWRPLLLAMACVALQILGGHPQYALFVAVAAGLHALIHSVADPGVRRRAFWVVVAAYAGGALLAAMQILPGWAATAESIRQDKLPYDFARVASLPPENLLTLLAPGFFGQLTQSDYWGRIYLWEGCLFVGVSGLALAALAFVDREHGRQTRWDLLIAGLLLVLALGDHTPLQHLLYDHAPGFGQLRTFAKFIFPGMLFVALAIGAGADAILRQHPVRPGFAPGVIGVGVVTVGIGFLLWIGPMRIGSSVEFVQSHLDAYGTPMVKGLNAAIIERAGVRAGWTLAAGGTLLVMVGIIILLARRRAGWGLVWLALVPVELLVFAGKNLATAHPEDLASKDIQQFLAVHPGDYRMINLDWLDGGYFYRVPSMWDDDPTVLKRYAEFFHATQGLNPDRANQYLLFNKLPPIFTLLRFRYAFVRLSGDGLYRPIVNASPMPRALLISDYQVSPGRDAILTALQKPDFTPEKQVILEREPTPQPQPGAAPGTVKVVEINSDQLTIEADTPAPTLLLITDLYSRDWRARPLPGSVQQKYEILPADYIVRAIPLSAGHHHLMVEYAPPSFRTGLIISAVAWAAWAGALFFLWRKSGGLRAVEG